MGQPLDFDLAAVIPWDRELPERLGRYAIREVVGRGATSLVFVARDEQGGQDVALKVLVPTFERPAVRRERFLREGQTLVRLRHPNIVPIHDVGEDQGYCYLAMDRMQRSLAAAEVRGAGLSRHLLWVHDAALGLLHAHRHGVIHRDVKPQNLLVGEDGRVRVGDFGLALLEGGGTLTLSGTPLGTPYYASPEQMRGEVATAQSDIFGLGATLYELVVGAPPSRPAPELPVQTPPGLPSGVRDILRRSLALSPAERFRDMGELITALELARRQIERASWRALAALRAYIRSGRRKLAHARRPMAVLGLLVLVVYGLGAPDALSGMRSTPGFLERYRRPATLAILPFSAPHAEDGDLAEGLTHEIIRGAAGYEGLRVVGADSAARYRGTAGDVATLGRELGVAAILRGRLEVLDRRLHVTTSLVDTASGRELWSQSYSQSMAESFDIPHEVVHAVATALAGPSTSPAAVRAPAPPRDIAAYALYLEGQAHLETHSQRGIEAATGFFKAALVRDPGLVEALAGLAECYEALWDYGSQEDRDGPLLAAAEAYARRAVLQDPRRDLAYAALGNVLQSRGDWVGAEAALATALRISPGSAAAHAQYASLLALTGRNSEAKRQILKALELDPLSPYIVRQAGRFHFYEGEYQVATEFLLAALDLNPHDPNTERLLADTYRALGDPEMDLTARLRLFPWLARPPVRVAAWLLGPEPMLKVLSRARTWRGHQSSPQRGLALAKEYAWLGEADEMFAALAVASSRQLWYATVEPGFAPYRTDPRFTEILARVGLRSPVKAPKK